MTAKIKLLNGLNIAFKRWNAETNLPKILCIHGWLDNSNSFAYLGPALASKGFDVAAFDHIGHGFSDHYHSDSSLQYLNRVMHVRGVLDGLGWSNASIIGHSMGAGVGMVYAACFPENVSKLILIDGFGATTKNTNEVSRLTRTAIEAEAKYLTKQKTYTNPKLYDTFKSAIDARIRNVATFPGKQSLSYEAAAQLVARGVEIYQADSSHHKPRQELDLSDTSVGPVRFVHDQRQYLPYYSYLSAEQLRAYISDIKAPTLLIKAETGWPMNNLEQEDAKKSAFKAPLEVTTLPGSHHLHLDPHTAPATADALLSFLEQK